MIPGSVKKQVLDGSENASLGFRELADALHGFYQKYSVPFIPYRDVSLPHFSKLPVEFQKIVLSTLGEVVDLNAEMERNGEKPVDSAKLLWRSLNRLGWRPLSDIFDKIESDDVVEIYSDANLQVFRNMNFFRHITISLEEICTHPWYQIAEMDKAATEYYATLAPKMKNNSITETYRTPIPKYLAKELMGEKKVLEITPRWMSPVFAGSQCVGMISLVKSRTR
jgi:hypothetical protein